MHDGYIVALCKLDCLAVIFEVRDSPRWIVRVVQPEQFGLARHIVGYRVEIR